MLSIISRLDRFPHRPIHKLRRLFVGTAPLSPPDAKDFYVKYGVKPVQSYGLSELLFVSLDHLDCEEYGTVGTPLKDVDIAFDNDSRISISSPYQFMGYLVDGTLIPSAPRFITSDLGCIDRSGMLVINGRCDDIIIRGGVNINPICLEQNLHELLSMCKFCVVGIPDPCLGQRVSLVTESRELDNKEKENLFQFVRSLPGRQTIDEFLSVEKFPTTVTGKVKRTELVQLLTTL